MQILNIDFCCYTSIFFVHDIMFIIFTILDYYFVTTNGLIGIVF